MDDRTEAWWSKAHGKTRTESGQSLNKEAQFPGIPKTGNTVSENVGSRKLGEHRLSAVLSEGGSISRSRGNKMGAVRVSGNTLLSGNSSIAPVRCEDIPSVT